MRTKTIRLHGRIAMFSALLAACAGVKESSRMEKSEILSMAINSLAGRGECVEGDFSTEDAGIISVIKNKNFKVIEYTRENDGGEVFHRFILRSVASPDILTAEVVFVGGVCREYTFGKIVE